MSVFKNINNGTEIIVNCHCGCDEGLRFKVDKLDSEYYCVLTYTNGAFYRDQNDTVWKVISKKLKKIWAIIRNKDYYYSEIIMSKDDFADFRKYLIMVDILDENGEKCLVSIKICCDFCDKPLEIVEEAGGIDYIKYYFTKELNTTKVFPNLCENCAMKLDDALKYARGEWIKQLNISSKNTEINKERREKLGTKG